MRHTDGTTERNTIRVGIIGFGRATALMLPALKSFPHIVVSAVADPRPAARALFGQHFPAGSTYAGAEQLCADPGIDAVVIATPPEMHRTHVELAAAAGKHILVEKPMAPTLDDCDRMIEAAGRWNVRLIVGPTLAFSPAVRAIAEAVATREFGRLGSIHSLYYTDYLYRPRRAEDLVPGPGAGIVLNQLPHLIDCIRLVAGGVIEEVVGASSWAWDPQRPVPAAASAYLRLGDRATATLLYSGYDRFDSSVWSSGLDEDGLRVTRKPGMSRRALSEPARPPQVPPTSRSTRPRGDGEQAYRQPQPGVLLVSCEHADLRPSPDGIFVYSEAGCQERRIAQPAWPAGRTDALCDLYRAVTEDAPQIHDGHWGKATVEACLAIESAAVTGQSVRLTAQVQAER
jgi:phthalate 4,5-cis-dihydrodiol dehydrogenase